MIGWWAGFLGLALALPPGGDRPQGAKKPRLQLRAAPITGYVPETVRLTATLVDASDVEEWYCPQVEWNWNSVNGDETNTSLEEPECPAFTPETKVQRTFNANHVYPDAGQYDITLTLKHNGKALATAVVRITRVLKGWRSAAQTEGHP